MTYLSRSRLSASLLALFASACDMPAEDLLDVPADLAQVQSAATVCPDVSGTQPQSIVETDPTVLAQFSFARTMNALRSSSGGLASTETNGRIFQRWMRTFGSTSAAGDCNDAGIDPNKYGLTCPRAPELKLAGVNPFVAGSTVTFNPVGLFNRFDLAPANGANCGEYRIVYAMNSTNPTIAGRAFIIFEAVLPNPNPAAGRAACLPVARFWQALSTDASAASRATKLSNFYFAGTAVPGFSPVVRAAHYGMRTNESAVGPGQIRTNFFIDFAEWHLREYKLKRTCTDPATPATCTLSAAHVTVKNNPAEELFAGGHVRTAAFRTAFVPNVNRLRVNDISRIGMVTNNNHNEFESVSQLNNVVYASVADGTIRGQIATELMRLGSTLTTNNILARATTQTCAGCHQVSNGAPLGGGLTWPNSAGFVHITEARTLSPALVNHFIPHRVRVLESFINAECVPATTTTTAARAATTSELPAADSGLTLGGSTVGAAN